MKRETLDLLEHELRNAERHPFSGRFLLRGETHLVLLELIAEARGWPEKAVDAVLEGHGAGQEDGYVTAFRDFLFVLGLGSAVSYSVGAEIARLVQEGMRRRARELVAEDDERRGR